jgi:serralysin
MPEYTIFDQNDYNANKEITENLFGVNTVTTFDQEFASNESSMADNVKSMGITTLRYPGGSATENFFDMKSPNSIVSTYSSSNTLLPMDAFFEQAGRIDADVTIVIPTKAAFGISAGEAMLNGMYGERVDVSASYVEDVLEFVAGVVSESIKNGVEVKAFEVGNEFWGSGQMTAKEYGIVAATVAERLEGKLDELGYSSADIVVQALSSASQFFSPKSEAAGYVSVEDGEYSAYSQAYVNKYFDGVVPEGWTEVLVPGQGSARSQLADLVGELNGVSGAGNAVDGVVQHYYQSNGFGSVDSDKSFLFAQFRWFSDNLDRLDSANPLSINITEWNTNAASGLNNRGLQQASMMVEIFSELTTNGVDSAQIWPLSFNNAQGISLVSSDGNELTIAGTMYQLMAESLVGLTPSLDWSVENQIDIHGFSNDSRVVLFVSERSGLTSSDIELSIGGIIPEGNYFLTGTELWDDGAGGNDEGADPVLSYMNGRTLNSGEITISLNSWANMRLEVTYVGTGDDVVIGRGGSDYIRGFGGADELFGNDGNDTVYGGGGDDQIFGGNGKDALFGGMGDDRILGGIGDDTVAGGWGNDRISGGNGDDSAKGGWGIDRILGGEGDDTLYGNRGNDGVFGGDGKDVLYGGWGNDRISGGKGDDTASGGRGSDIITGGNGDDILYGESGSDSISGGNGEDTLYGGLGNDTLVSGRGNDILWGGEGADVFIFSNGSGRDTIRDFDFSQDTLVVSGEVFTGGFEQLENVGDGGGSMFVYYGNGDSIELLGDGTLDQGELVLSF